MKAQKEIKTSPVRLIPPERFVGRVTSTGENAEHGTLILAPADTEFDAELCPLSPEPRNGQFASAPVISSGDAERLRGGKVLRRPERAGFFRRLLGLG